MKNLLTVGALALALANAGCATTASTGTTQVTPQSVISTARQIALGICAVAPTAEAITQIVIANNLQAQSSATQASQAAAVFCQAVVAGAQ